MTHDQRSAQRKLTGLLTTMARLSEDAAEVRIWRDPRDDGQTMMSIDEVTDMLDVLGVPWTVVLGVPRPQPFGRRFPAHGIDVRAAVVDVAPWSPMLRKMLAQLAREPDRGDDYPSSSSS